MSNKWTKNILTVVFVSVLVGVLAGTFVSKNTSWSNGFNNGFCDLPTSDIARMYEGYVDKWKEDAKIAFDKAEKEVYIVDPTPDILGPDPDASKCVCKGSGVITHGDGHKTACPYHGSKDSLMKINIGNKELTFKPLLIGG